MKRRIKNFVRWTVRKSSTLRKIIVRLNNLVVQDEGIVPDTSLNVSDEKMFTEKAMYRGNFVDYLNYKLLTKEERSNELKRIFYNNCNYYLDLDNPRTFNQKLQWLKLNYADPIMSRCVDKCEFKR